MPGVPTQVFRLWYRRQCSHHRRTIGCSRTLPQRICRANVCIKYGVGLHALRMAMEFLRGHFKYVL
ncbi:hypothetical protein M413DRAFT_120715 [Hebeloma cylindrosporum]|uniref:Uncharacterized protein n=1 Tax=Hebeloma cylindrosporum TaxID=76867 RepID=A0A0C3CEL0_HEBCY|nr:hypothetical protein M413DRAFT_120715 [Hebeloma cylindrosporum h7]